MNPEIKQKWIEALRSGKYKQGHYKLRPSPDTYCCLGVLCDVVGSTGWEGGTGLPDDVQIATGVSLAGKLRFQVAGYENLMNLNDHAKYDFNQIADIIEEQL